MSIQADPKTVIANHISKQLTTAAPQNENDDNTKPEVASVPLPATTIKHRIKCFLLIPLQIFVRIKRMIINLNVMRHHLDILTDKINEFCIHERNTVERLAQQQAIFEMRQLELISKINELQRALEPLTPALSPEYRGEGVNIPFSSQRTGAREAKV